MTIDGACMFDALGRILQFPVKMHPTHVEHCIAAWNVFIRHRHVLGRSDIGELLHDIMTVHCSR